MSVLICAIWDKQIMRIYYVKSSNLSQFASSEIGLWNHKYLDYKDKVVGS